MALSAILLPSGEKVGRAAPRMRGLSDMGETARVWLASPSSVRLRRPPSPTRGEGPYALPAISRRALTNTCVGWPPEIRYLSSTTTAGTEVIPRARHRACAVRTSCI